MIRKIAKAAENYPHSGLTVLRLMFQAITASPSLITAMSSWTRLMEGM